MSNLTKNVDFFVLILERKQQKSRQMESAYLTNKLSPSSAPNRSIRRKTNGAATAALLIQMATEFLTASPTMRQRANITLMDLAAADKVRKSLLKTPLKS